MMTTEEMNQLNLENKLTEAEELLRAAQSSVQDPDLQNAMDLFFGRRPSNKTAKIILNEQAINLGTCSPTVADVRAKLPPELAGYTILREQRGPDQTLTDLMRIFDGDVLYTVPPCSGA